MRKRTKLGWMGLFIATLVFVVSKSYFDAKVFDRLNTFHQSETEQNSAPQNITEFTGSTKTLSEQAAEMAQEAEERKNAKEEEGPKR